MLRMGKRMNNENLGHTKSQSRDSVNHVPLSNGRSTTSREVDAIPEKYHIPKQRFEFITGTHPSRNKDLEVRKLVRAHVMRSFRRQQHLRIAHRSRTSPPSASSGTEDQQSTNIERDKPVSGYHVMKTIPQSNDPLFGTFPVEIQPPLQKQLIRYLTTVPGVTYPFDSLSRHNPIRAERFRCSITDKVLFHSLLCFT
jgi:hypothetical protein